MPLVFQSSALFLDVLSSPSSFLLLLSISHAIHVLSKQMLTTQKRWRYIPDSHRVMLFYQKNSKGEYSIFLRTNLAWKYTQDFIFPIFQIFFSKKASIVCLFALLIRFEWDSLCFFAYSLRDMISLPSKYANRLK